ncbi:hypothetical protein DVH05_014984 [Phytophthora capsici]|nr:hypothetical protein DVH05_014984 [Phytophthora capsici]
MPLPSCCQVCGPSATASPESLFKCSRCQSVLYCGREHQTEDFASHKATCRRIKKMREKMAQEEEIVRNSTEDFWTPANAFETHVGHFWGLRGTRPYMTAKLEVIRALSTIPSRPAIEAALAEAMDSMRLCRVDNLGIREVIPTLMLILDQYQEAYDFIKWYATTGDDDHYDWGNMDLPFLDVRNADMTEEIPGSMRNGRDVFFMSNLAYIKLMLAKTVKDAINAHNQGRTSLPSIESLRAVVAPNGTMRSVTELKRLHKKLTSQMHAASSLAHFQNQHFWNGVLDPTPIVQAPKPPHYAPGDINQVKLWVLQSAMLWRDHHDFIREKRSAYPDYLPEMPQRGIQQLVTFP